MKNKTIKLVCVWYAHCPLSHAKVVILKKEKQSNVLCETDVIKQDSNESLNGYVKKKNTAKYVTLNYSWGQECLCDETGELYSMVVSVLF